MFTRTRGSENGQRVYSVSDWPFYGRPEGGKKGCACVNGRVYLLGDRTRVR